MRISIRPARREDVPAIAALIGRYADRNLMLPRAPASILAGLPDWLVAVDAEVEPEPSLLGCASLTRLSPQLAELRSLAVCESGQRAGIGGQMVERIVEMAEHRGFDEICALTLRAGFFQGLGFEIVERWRIGPKIWRDCIHCPKRDRCDELAVLRSLSSALAIPPLELSQVRGYPCAVAKGVRG